MEKIIFFGLVIPIIVYVLYLGATAIMEGFKAKEANRAEKEEKVEQEADLNSAIQNKSLSEELEKLKELQESGVITQEDFDKAKNKLLND